jgi:hypothetical protein
MVSAPERVRLIRKVEKTFHPVTARSLRRKREPSGAKAFIAAAFCGTAEAVPFVVRAHRVGFVRTANLSRLCRRAVERAVEGLPFVGPDGP